MRRHPIVIGRRQGKNGRDCEAVHTGSALRQLTFYRRGVVDFFCAGLGDENEPRFEAFISRQRARNPHPERN